MQCVGMMMKNNQVKKENAEKEGKGNEIIEKAKKLADELRYKARQEAKEIAREEKENGVSVVDVIDPL